MSNVTTDKSFKVAIALALVAALIFSAVLASNPVAEAATAKKYTVTFKAQGGKAVKAKSIKAKAKLGKLPSTTKTGYMLKGWYTKASGGTKVKTTTKVAKKTTLYAQWTAKSFKVTFNANGGSAVSAKTLKYNTAIGTLPTPIKANATFKGWYTKASGGTKIAATTKVTKVVTYYAQWNAGKGSKPTEVGLYAGQVKNGWTWVAPVYDVDYESFEMPVGWTHGNGYTFQDIETTYLGRPFTDTELWALAIQNFTADGTTQQEWSDWFDEVLAAYPNIKNIADLPAMPGGYTPTSEFDEITGKGLFIPYKIDSVEYNYFGDDQVREWFFDNYQLDMVPSSGIGFTMTVAIAHYKDRSEPIIKVVTPGYWK